MKVLIVLRATAVASLAAFSYPALATPPIPAPEIGVGIVSMLLVGTAYTYLRRRLDRP